MHRSYYADTEPVSEQNMKIEIFLPVSASMECRLEIHQADRWRAISAARDHLLSGHFRDSETDCGSLGMQIKRRNVKNPMFICSTIKMIQLSQLNDFECRIKK